MRLRVDDLALSIAGLAPGDVHELIARIAVHLEAADAPSASRGTDRLRLELASVAGESVDATAARIARALVAALARAS